MTRNRTSHSATPQGPEAHLSHLHSASHSASPCCIQLTFFGRPAPGRTASSEAQKELHEEGPLTLQTPTHINNNGDLLDASSRALKFPLRLVKRRLRFKKLERPTTNIRDVSFGLVNSQVGQRCDPHVSAAVGSLLEGWVSFEAAAEQNNSASRQVTFRKTRPRMQTHQDSQSALFATSHQRLRFQHSDIEKTQP